MKQLILCLATCALFHTPVQAASEDGEISIGQTRREVRKILGEPRAEFKRGSMLILMYTRGTVQLLDGKVTDSDLLSKDEADKRETSRLATEKNRREHLRAQQEAARAQSKALSKDATFQQQAADERLAYWEKFAKDHPGVDVSTQLEAARSAAETSSTSESQSTELVKLQNELRELNERQASWDDRMALTKVNWERWELEDEKKADAARRNEVDQKIAQLKQLLGNKTDDSSAQGSAAAETVSPSSGPVTSTPPQGGPPGGIPTPPPTSQGGPPSL